MLPNCVELGVWLKQSKICKRLCNIYQDRVRRFPAKSSFEGSTSNIYEMCRLCYQFEGLQMALA